MTIYNINLGIGWASSGVEYAQAYRAHLFRNKKIPAKFVFMDMILADNIQHLTSNMGFQDDEIIWLYNHFTDIKIAPTTYRLQQVVEGVSGQADRVERNGKIVRYFYSQEDKFITCYLRNEEEDFVERVEYVSRGKLIRKDYFSYVRYASEYFAPDNQQAKLYLRRFYNEDGSLAYDIVMNEGKENLYRFPDQLFYSKQEFIRYFMQTLALKKSDIVLLDREKDIGQVIFEEAQKARLGVVIHAEHFSKNATNHDYILWNNFYDYQFTNADKIDFFIVATETQKEILTQQFERYTAFHPKIYTIPVGSLDLLRHPEKKRVPFSMITASRLATEKHLDWLIKATIEARKQLPNLTLDIYGSGGERENLSQLIEREKAQEYIRLKGHEDLTQVYLHYELYLTASTSEGFGLTLMEAVGSGLPLIGFDVPYGNQTFIRDGENGYLLPISSDHVESFIVDSYARKICKVYTDNLLETMREKSYQLAQDYLTNQVETAWERLIKENSDDSII